MASREKKPLAPSKAKQKANNDSGLQSNEIKSRKGKSLSNLKQQQLARDIIEAVATDSQLPPKLEASLPRKKVLRNLKHKQKLRVTKASLIKSKVTRKVTSRNLCRITSDIKKSQARAKRAKLSVESSSIKATEIGSRTVENHVNEAEGESIGIDGGNRSAKNNLRTKKTKFIPKTSEVESEVTPDRDTDSLAGSSTKSSPKLSRKGRSLENLDTLPRSVKSTKFTGFKRNSVKPDVDIKYTKGRKSTARDIDCGNIRVAKSLLDTKSSIDLTIDEVIACSMLSDSEIDSQQGIEKIEGKVTRSKKMFVEECTVPDIEIKKEPDSETDAKIITSDGENQEAESVQSAIQLRKRSNASISQRSLRNGKLRQSDHTSGVTAVDLDPKKRRRLNSDDPVSSEVSTDKEVADSNVDTESCFSESSCNDPQQAIAVPAKDELKSFEDSSQTGLPETENNNNNNNNNNGGDNNRTTSEIGPTLRSKTKAKSTEVEVKSETVNKGEYGRIGGQEELKKSNADQARKDNILAKLTDKTKGRRSSLNIDMKKTVNSFYGAEKPDGNPKSQIDQMIENIKLTIAKSIESKIFGPEKGLGLSKNFEVPKIEEIIAPLSAESQKLGLEENADEEKSAISRNEINKSDSTENSVAELKPKVADTAKEIEKLVMGDIELAETHSQNVQESEPPPDTDANGPEVVHVIEVSDNTTSRAAKDQQEESSEVSDSIEEREKEQVADDQARATDDGKKAGVARKSSRTTDKGSPPENDDAVKKLGKVLNRVAQKSSSDRRGELSADSDKPVGIIISNVVSLKDESTSKAVVSESSVVCASVTSKQVQDEEAVEEKAMKTDETVKVEAKDSSSEVAAESEDEEETLESITKEVERLVTEDQLETSANETQCRPESTSKTEVVPSSPSELDAIDVVKQEVVSVAKVDEKNNAGAESEVEVTENAKEVEKSEEETTAQLAKDSDSTSLVSSDTCNLIEDVRKDAKESEKDDKRGASNNDADNNDSNKDSAEEKDVLYNNSENNDATTTALREETERLNNVVEEQKLAASDDNKKRVLRARDKTKKHERGQTSSNKERNEGTVKIKLEEEACQKSHEEDTQELEEKIQKVITEDTDDTQNSTETETTNELERQARTRRSREAKKRKDDQLNTLKNKRPKREIRRYDQQNKEETLLDNEVAKINENNRSFLNKYGNNTECTANFRGFSEGVRGSLEKCQDTADNIRSKSENDLIIAKEPSKKTCENRLSRNLSENHVTKQTENIDILDADCKPIKTPETSQKDSDETSTSGESSSSVNITPKILETPEDKAKKESILGILGLEPLEKAAERLNHQKAKKEQSTGTLRTVIRVHKEKEKDKRRSRSPLKMVLKQGRGDGEGDSPENFYTIQKEFGTSGWGDSSSGANRKFSTNHRHSCDEDNEDTAPKDRQSLVIPEKSSSFSIHPGRLCADVCCYCFGKFGSLDTPMHLAQMKSDERRKKILNIERHLTKDSCLCDACYRHVDRKANTSPTNMQTKPQKQHRQLMVSKCSARECRDAARHHVKRRWLLKIKAGLQKQVDIDWESSQHTSMSFCVSHYSKIERFLACALCKRRLARNHTHQLSNVETDELNQLLGQQGIPVILAASTFVCKLCRYFTQLQLKYKDVDNMNTNHKSFFKSYRKRILHYHNIEVLETEDEDPSQSQAKDKDKDKDKDKRKKNKCSTQPKTGTSKSPDGTTNSASEKSTPEPTKNEGVNSEADTENRAAKVSLNDENVAIDVQFLGIESTVEKLKKRKLLDMHSFTTSDTSISCDNPNEVVEILAMDKEVTLTRLPKKPRANNDITPVVQRLGANPSISVRTLFPGEEEMNLHANIEFANVREITPQGWEKCATMIQYDRDTKLLWQELQRPYGNQSSFLRHLILLEKYYRSGDLVLAPNASRNAINYSTSVQNRLISYEGPEKMDEPIMEPIASEYHNSRRLSGGYVLERDKHSLPSTSTPKQLSSTSGAQSAKGSPPRVLKLNPGVSIIKKPPPNLQRLNLPSTSANSANGNARRKESGQKLPASSGGKVFQLSEPEFKRLQSLKKQKQQMLTEKQPAGSNCSAGVKTPTQYQKAQLVAQTQFQKHLRMQQEMLSRQSRSDFEPLICDVRTLANENSPTQNLLHNLNLPKSIQVTTKTCNQIPILPKIPKSLTVIPQTVTRPAEK
ncbi:uncharacterized protein LOC122538844 isoform X2 [Frieseomelitta varia]|nr:uncharacterized protein LOC122538844 isoform X2 [Frieseomelitta varia]XP_043529232.1 uncharacterized protein LOC122538844 isoform X2 [Frieseomelitta varia]XP_043529233.1 uncharacterized protein LOC122538844 isoform X2 [Frieseomelitta varia]